MPRPARIYLPLTAAVFAVSSLAAFADDPALTIYNQNFAVVRETARLDLKKGANTVAFSDVTGLLEPDSVVLRDPAGKRRLRIVEQNFRADTASQERLLALYEGKTIDFLVPPAPGVEGPGQIVRGKIVRASGVLPVAGQGYYGGGFGGGYGYNNSALSGSIVEVDGKLRFGLPGTPLFPAPADGSLLLKPTLEWTLETDQAGPLAAELAYVSGGFTWKADYNLVAPETGDTVDLVGWVTMQNNSGRTFEDARVQLMAGDVSKIQPDYYGGGGFGGGRVQTVTRSVVPPPVTEKSFDEYHLYTLARRTTLRDRQTKQVEFARAEGVKATRIYVYDGAKIDYNRYRGYSSYNLLNEREYGTQSNNKIWVMREFANTKANGLGIPLPKGRVRFYRREAGAGGGDALQFIGENTIDHTPQGETLRVYTGDAFDLIGERRQTNFKVETGRFVDESFEITLRNRKKEPVEIRVVETLYRGLNWNITQKSDSFTKKDFQTVEFRVTLKPDEERKITYTVHYTW